MTATSKFISTIAANVASALATVDMATDVASAVKFTAIAEFAAGVAMRLRIEHIQKGSNLQTDGKGRVIALVDISKDERAALVAAFEQAGIKDKDAANIGSMGRTVALHFIDAMLTTGAVHVAKDGNEMKAFVTEHLLVATGGVATYHAIEKARGRKWEAPIEVEAETVEDVVLDMETPFGDAPMPQAAGADDATDDATDAPVSAEDTLNNEVRAAIRCIDAAVARGDFARLIEQGFRPVIQAALQGIQQAEQAEAQALAAEEAEALRAKADKVEKKVA